MKLILRLLWLLATARRRSRCSPLGPCETVFRVLPNDLDVFLHVNNGVYLTIADLGRTDMLLRAGVFARVRRLGWYPVVAAETIRFRRSLRLWQRFTITTRVLGWGERSIYIEQRFRTADEEVAHLVVDARFLARGGGRVAVRDLLDAFGLDGESPPLPDWVERWAASGAGTVPAAGQTSAGPVV